MTKWKSSDVGFFNIGGYELLGITTKLEESSKHKVMESTHLGSAYEEWFSGGTKSWNITQDGFFDDDADSIHAALKGLPAGELILMFAPHGNIAGRKFIGHPQMTRTNYSINVSVGDIQKAKSEYGFIGLPEEGYIVAPLAARTTAGNTKTASCDIGTAGTNGGYIYHAVQSIDLDGGTKAVVLVEHSTDGNTWGTKSTLADVTAAGSWRTTISGDIYQYLAISWTWTGGSSPTMTNAVGVVVNPAA